MLSDQEIANIRKRCEAASPGPWRSCLEKRDKFSGSDFIQTPNDDMYISGCGEADYDFIANARQDIPMLLSEIDRLRSIGDCSDT